VKPVLLGHRDGEPCYAVEIEKGDPTGCPIWCVNDHIGDHLMPGEQITHERYVEYRLSFASETTTSQKDGEGDASVHIWQQGDDLSINALDSLGQELVEGLSPIGAWCLAWALREAALRAQPLIKVHEDNMRDTAALVGDGVHIAA
jgi:hypothetical protein